MAGWGIVYYQTAVGVAPVLDFMEACPKKVRATLAAVLEAVRTAPPPAFSGGGKWEAMHGSMNGYYEARVTGPGRTHYRLFCILDNGTPEELEQRGFEGPQIAVINGLMKPHGHGVRRGRLPEGYPRSGRGLPRFPAAPDRHVSAHVSP